MSVIKTEVTRTNGRVRQIAKLTPNKLDGEKLDSITINIEIKSKADAAKVFDLITSKDFKLFLEVAQICMANEKI